LRDIGDARMILDEAAPDLSAAIQKPTRKLAWILRALLVLVTVGAVVALFVKEPPPPSHRAVAHVTVPLPERTGAGVAPLALSRDGSRLVYATAPGRPLYLRQMDQLEPKLIAGTENSFGVGIPPDGQSLCFWQQGRLKKVEVSGGPIVTLCDATNFFGVSWGTAQSYSAI
jgi:hypothetical protein